MFAVGRVVFFESFESQPVVNEYKKFLLPVFLGKVCEGLSYFKQFRVKNFAGVSQQTLLLILGCVIIDCLLCCSGDSFCLTVPSIQLGSLKLHNQYVGLEYRKVRNMIMETVLFLKNVIATQI